MKSRRTDSDLEEAPKPSSMYLLYSSGTGPVKDSIMQYSRWPINRHA